MSPKSQKEENKKKKKTPKIANLETGQRSERSEINAQMSGFQSQTAKFFERKKLRW